MRGRWLGVSVVGLGALACSGTEPRVETSGPPPTTAGVSSATDGPESSTSLGDSTGADSSTGEKIDVGTKEPPLPGGCAFIDMLFVIDNSESMQTYQEALTTEFPNFMAETFALLPPGIDVHVGITTTEFDLGCNDAEATANCQTSSTPEEVQAHYVEPSTSNDGGNGSQGRLFEWAGQRWFEANSDDDPAQVVEWFSGAAVAAGEEGCSFEMPVAAAGWAMDPANADTNAGFVRDAGGLLVIFMLTDEPDKSPLSDEEHAEQVLAAKAQCGGADCVFISGLIPTCVPDVNQKLWQFMSAFDDEPPWGDIENTSAYGELFGSFLADGVAQACSSIPAG